MVIEQCSVFSLLIDYQVVASLFYQYDAVLRPH